MCTSFKKIKNDGIFVEVIEENKWGQLWQEALCRGN
jgi:hypothetical protein